MVAIEDIVNAQGQKQKYIVIEKNDKTDEFLYPNMEDFSPSSLVERIKEAGIVGLGGAGFPTAVKLDAEKKGIIKKNYNPESYIPNEIEFNKTFLKS